MTTAAPPPPAMVSLPFPVPIIIDTREQLPYLFDRIYSDAREGKRPLAITTARGTLPSGDYSLLGFEDEIIIERKSITDLFGTLGQGRQRFERELERLETLPSPHVVIEACWEVILSSPPERSRLNPKTVHRSIIAWTMRHPRIHWWMMGNRRLAEITTFRILERWYKQRTGMAPGRKQEQ